MVVKQEREIEHEALLAEEARAIHSREHLCRSLARWACAPANKGMKP